MAANTIITIGRQTGSGGRDIGKLLAKELGINDQGSYRAEKENRRVVKYDT